MSYRRTSCLAHAWPGLVVEEISLRVHIAEVRKALGDGKEGARYITNIPSRGYCFVAPVQRMQTRLAVQSAHGTERPEDDPRLSCLTAWSG